MIELLRKLSVGYEFVQQQFEKRIKCFKYLLVNGYNMKGLIRMIFIFFNLFQLLILEDVLWFLGIVLVQCNLDLWFVKKVFRN